MKKILILCVVFLLLVDIQAIAQNNISVVVSKNNKSTSYGQYGIITQQYFYLNSSALNNPYIQLK